MCKALYTGFHVVRSAFKILLITTVSQKIPTSLILSWLAEKFSVGIGLRPEIAVHWAKIYLEPLGLQLPDASQLLILYLPWSQTNWSYHSRYRLSYMYTFFWGEDNLCKCNKSSMWINSHQKITTVLYFPTVSYFSIITASFLQPFN